MPINEQEILQNAAASLARMEAELIGQRDELLRNGSEEMAGGARAADRVIDYARKIREIILTTHQEGDQA